MGTCATDWKVFLPPQREPLLLILYLSFNRKTMYVSYVILNYMYTHMYIMKFLFLHNGSIAPPTVLCFLHQPQVWASFLLAWAGLPRAADKPVPSVPFCAVSCGQQLISSPSLNLITFSFAHQTFAACALHAGPWQCWAPGRD